MDSPKVFIIILNYNGADCIRKTLTSVFRLNYSNLEIVLVDNNSVDGSFEAVKKEFSRVTLIKNSENLGFSSGNNIGIEYALERGADYVWLLNYDTQVEKNSLAPLIDLMEKEKEVGMASPVVLEGESERIWFSGGKIDWFKMKSTHETALRKKNYYNSDYLSGCALLVRTEVFRRVGLLDEDFFLYWEDVDFSVRVKKEKYKIVVCFQSQIRHFEKSQEKKANKLYWLVLSGLIFFQKNTPSYLRGWIFFYVLGRKLKNWKDIKKKKTPINEAVRRAYQDLKYVK